MPAAARGGGNPGQTTPDLVRWVIERGGNSFGWLEPEKSQTSSRGLSFGFNVRGDLYYPANTPDGAKLPTVIWLHGYSYPLGYMWVYQEDTRAAIDALEKDSLVDPQRIYLFGYSMGEPLAFMRRRSTRASKAWSPSADSRLCATTPPTAELAEWRATATNAD